MESGATVGSDVSRWRHCAAWTPPPIARCPATGTPWRRSPRRRCRPCPVPQCRVGMWRSHACAEAVRPARHAAASPVPCAAPSFPRSPTSRDHEGLHHHTQPALRARSAGAGCGRWRGPSRRESALAAALRRPLPRETAQPTAGAGGTPPSRRHTGVSALHTARRPRGRAGTLRFQRTCEERASTSDASGEAARDCSIVGGTALSAVRVGGRLAMWRDPREFAPLVLCPIAMATAIRWGLALAIAAGLSLHGRRKKSLDRGGALAAFAVGFVSFGASYRIGAQLLFFYGLSSRLTRVGTERKRVLEDDHRDGACTAAARRGHGSPRHDVAARRPADLDPGPLEQRHRINMRSALCGLGRGRGRGRWRTRGAGGDSDLLRHCRVRPAARSRSTGREGPQLEPHCLIPPRAAAFCAATSRAARATRGRRSSGSWLGPSPAWSQRRGARFPTAPTAASPWRASAPAPQRGWCRGWPPSPSCPSARRPRWPPRCVPSLAAWQRHRARPPPACPPSPSVNGAHAPSRASTSTQVGLLPLAVCGAVGGSLIDSLLGATCQASWLDPERGVVLSSERLRSVAPSARPVSGPLRSPTAPASSRPLP